MTKILEVEPWLLCDLTLTPEKVAAIWQLLQRHTTLFSDLTRDDPRNFIRAVTAPYTLWYEVREHDTLVGIIWFSDLHLVTEITAHMAFFDRRATEKVPLCKEVVRWMFRNFPIQRINVTPPDIYIGTIRLLRKLGFTHEGTKRRAVLLGGKWRDQLMFGITRPEVQDELSNRQDPAA